MTIMLSRLYPDGATAHAVVEELKAAGLSGDDIGIISPSHDRSAAIGGAAGLLAGLSAFVLPGIGAVVAAGWLASAVSGTAARGIAGALVEAGAAENDAARSSDGVKRGGTLIAVRVAGEDRDFYEEILTSRAVRPVSGKMDQVGVPVQSRDRNLLDIKRP